ncbi:CAP domain-containing protein [Butyrivibrio sp. JL13D10]|uniref:CAP domain-containing protein n=1 Tax=Butyrivibrio sp. JL13D10 TaxID=3236815 RepID=UPI0038B60FB2
MGRVIKSILLSVFFIFLTSINVSAADTMSLPITGTYDQSSARELLSLLNNERSKVEGLNALSYDQELEDAAMIRAMEISVFFDGTRPDGSKWYTVLNNPSSASQLKAYGQTTPAAALSAWMSGENNKAALLSSDYSYMGASHVTREGVQFWIIILRKAKGNVISKTPVDDKRVVNISMLSSNVLSNVTPVPIDMEYGDVYDISGLKEQCGYSGARSFCKKWSYDLSDTITISDDGIISLEDKKITGKKAGYTGITAILRSSGNSIVIPVNVAKKIIKEDHVSLSAREFQYTGKAIRPSVSVVISGQKLTEGFDYVMTYSDNVNVSSKGGYATVIGTGNYDGTVLKYFMIEGIDIGTGTITLSDNSLLYTGGAITPSYTVTCNGKVLTEGTDYIGKFTDNIEPGTATLTVYGMGNYKGTVSSTFTIGEKVSDIISSSVPKSKLTTVTASKKKISVKWKKVSSIDGYEVQYSTSKKFTTATTVSKTYKAVKKKAVLKKLKSGRKYYVRIRSYKISGHSRLCSTWSKVKKIKVK